MLDKVAVGLDTRWVNQGVTRMGNSTVAAAPLAHFTPSAGPTAAAPRLGLSLSWLSALWSAGALALAIYLWVTHYRLSRRVIVRRLLIDAPAMNLLEALDEQR